MFVDHLHLSGIKHFLLKYLVEQQIFVSGPFLALPKDLDCFGPNSVIAPRNLQRLPKGRPTMRWVNSRVL